MAERLHTKFKGNSGKGREGLPGNQGTANLILQDPELESAVRGRSRKWRAQSIKIGRSNSRETRVVCLARIQTHKTSISYSEL